MLFEVSWKEVPFPIVLLKVEPFWSPKTSHVDDNGRIIRSPDALRPLALCNFDCEVLTSAICRGLHWYTMRCIHPSPRCISSETTALTHVAFAPQGSVVLLTDFAAAYYSINHFWTFCARENRIAWISEPKPTKPKMYESYKETCRQFLTHTSENRFQPRTPISIWPTLITFHQTKHIMVPMLCCMWPKVISNVTNGIIFFICSTSAISAPLCVKNSSLISCSTTIRGNFSEGWEETQTPTQRRILKRDCKMHTLAEWRKKPRGKLVATEEESGNVDLSEYQAWSEENVTRKLVAYYPATEKPSDSKTAREVKKLKGQECSHDLF